MTNNNKADVLPRSNNWGGPLANNDNPRYDSDMSDCKLIPIEELKSILRVSKSTIYRYLNNHSLPAVRVAGRTMVKMQDLKAFVDGLESYRGKIDEI